MSLTVKRGGEPNVVPRDIRHLDPPGSVPLGVVVYWSLYFLIKIPKERSPTFYSFRNSRRKNEYGVRKTRKVRVEDVTVDPYDS